ncbi:MAG TPA: ATP-binding protein [Burkholderiaceae bacterium]|nr:ATP-binding protein [Burkholderiaceae bacterium]
MKRKAEDGRPRRGTGEGSSAESWFAALGVGQDTQLEDDATHGESRYSDWTTEGAPADSRFLSRQARRLIASPQPSFLRIYRAFLGARAAVGLLLLVTQIAAHLGGTGGQPQYWGFVVCAAYAAMTTWMWRGVAFGPQPPADAAPKRLSRRQWVFSIGLDVLVFGALHIVAPRASVNFVPLLVLPVLMAGVLTSRTSALAVAAVVTLLLLAEAWLQVLGGADIAAIMVQTGLVGTGFFVIAMLAGELAGRLARQELAARGSMELARQQAQLNRLVIEEMQDGVLVVDRRSRVRAANPAARRLLAAEGMVRAAPFKLEGHASWLPLVEAVQRGFDEGKWPAAGRELTLIFGDGLVRELRVRMRFTKRRDAQIAEDLCVLFLEDLRDVQARIRQEKLAAMGRVSAGIAHEIRNPLAAISQANALLAEDASIPAQRQLTQMVADNVERLKRIVDDVMEVAPGGAHVRAEVIDLTASVARICGEWADTARLAAGAPGALQVELPGEPVGAMFDAEHLRRVLVNLLDNGLRHSSGKPGSVQVRLERQDQVAILSVASDGAPIPPDVERHLFEPFFSTRSRGTGLGLYICKELCERYGASIDYRLRSAQYTARNEFLIVMRAEPVAPHHEPAASLHLAR